VTDNARISEPDTVDAADLGEQVATALQLCEEISDVVGAVEERLTAVERHLPRVLPGEKRSDYRPDRYPPPRTVEDHAEQVARVEAAWVRLDDWVCWLVGVYRLASVIPPCWPEHTVLAHELIGLRVAWVGAWLDSAQPDALIAWHERLHRARARLADGNWGRPRCDGTHSGTGIDMTDIHATWTGDERRPRAVAAARRRDLLLIGDAPDTDAPDTDDSGVEGAADEADPAPTEVSR
jgi:hypothetical protein